MIQCSDVTVVLHGQTVLNRVSATLARHTTAIVGENGSGKSTFVRLLNGLVSATSGEVSVDGTDPAADVAAVRKRVGFVFSDPRTQLVMPTVQEDVAFSLRGSGLDRAEIHERALTALRDVGLESYAEASVHAISGGQQQLLALAGALVRQPSVVVADEPTALLDGRNARAISRRLFALDAQIVLVTHDLALARSCDEALWFADGTIAHSGEASAVVDAYERSLLELDELP